MWGGKMMCHKKASDIVINGHVDYVTQMALTDMDEFRAWLRDVLGLDNMSVEQMQNEFSPYFDGHPECEEND
jgi:hypothetical protein